MRLQILVNRYNEPERIVRRFLDSVAMQLEPGEFEVVIGDDGSDEPIPDDLMGDYPFARVLTFPHRGVSSTRNALLDQSDADYLMFCDIDDSFISTIGLNAVSMAINGQDVPCDVFSSTFVAERRESDGTFVDFLRIHLDTYFVHGKAFRREYLTENDIRWADEMVTIGADEVFLWQAMYLTKRILYCEEPLYMWRYNQSSVCRGEEDLFERSYFRALRAYELLIDDLLDKGITWLAERHAVAMTYDAYCMMNRKRWLELAGSEFIEAAEDKLVQLAGKYSMLLFSADHRVRETVWNEKRLNYAGECPDSRDGMDEWFWSVAERVVARWDEAGGGDARRNGSRGEGSSP